MCDVEENVHEKKLDDYEKEEKFTLEYVSPKQVIDANKACASKEADQIMLERECKVIGILAQEGYI